MAQRARERSGGPQVREREIINLKVGRLGGKINLTNTTSKLLDLLKYTPPYDEYMVRRNIIPKPEPINLYKILRINDKPAIFIPSFLLNDVICLFEECNEDYNGANLILPHFLGTHQKSISARLEISYMDLGAKYPLELWPYVFNDEIATKFYDYQNEATELMIQKFFNAEMQSKHKSSCVLNMPTGAGKTYIAALLTLKLHEKTLYITHRRRIMEQSSEVFRSFGLTVSNSVRSDPTEVTPPDVRIVVVNSLIGLDPDERIKIFDKYGFIVYDEVHRYCSKEFSEVFWITRSRYNLCMSATTDERNDGLDILYHIHHGPTVSAESMGVKAKIYHFDLTVKIIRKRWPDEYLEVERNKNGMRSVLRAAKLLNECLARTYFIINCLADLLMRRHCVYVLTHRREVVEQLHGLISTYLSRVPQLIAWTQEELADVPSFTTIHKMMGEMTNEDYAQAHQSGLIIVATYSYIREGISIPHMTAEIFADPPFTTTVKQCIGRIMRPGPNQTKPREIIDLVDSGSMFDHWSGDRNKIYLDLGHKIVRD